MLPYFKYNFKAGPVKEKEIDTDFQIGNCRLAVQLYFHLNHDLFLKPSQILLPQAYLTVGKFIVRNMKSPESLSKAQTGDIIYAERLRNGKGESVHQTQRAFKDKNEWILAFHTAIYLKGLEPKDVSQLPEQYELDDIDKTKPLIWHASAVEGKTCFWDLDKFNHYYLPRSIKRIL